MQREYSLSARAERSHDLFADGRDPGTDGVVAKRGRQAGELAGAAVRAERAAGKSRVLGRVAEFVGDKAVAAYTVMTARTESSTYRRLRGFPPLL